MKKCAIFLIIFIIFTFIFGGYKIFLSVTHPIKYQNLIIETSKKYNLEPSIVASLINVESSYEENAKSNKSAIGLMQVKLDTANYILTLNNALKIEEKQLFEPATNIEVGCMYLNYLNKKFNDIFTTLAAYNAGETRVRSWLSSTTYSKDKITLHYIPYKETENYIKKIKNNLKFYKKIYK